MDKVKVVEIIEKKIQEHQAEVNGSNKDLTKLQTAEVQGTSTHIMNASKRIILKDKIIFHKAAMLALHDLLEELKQL